MEWQLDGGLNSIVLCNEVYVLISSFALQQEITSIICIKVNDGFIVFVNVIVVIHGRVRNAKN